MKKTLLMFSLSLSLSTAAQAMSPDDFQRDLDTWQRSYPILEFVREEPLFKRKSAAYLKEATQQETTEDILLKTIRAIIPTYIKNMENYDYFILVEGLDPVTRDLTGPKHTKRFGKGRYPVEGISSKWATRQ